MNPEDLLELPKERLVQLLENANLASDQLMAEMVMIRQELLHRLEEEKKDGELIGEYSVTKAKRVNFKTTLEQAEELGAVKKAVDTSVLKKIYNKGVSVPGVEITTYLSVRRLSQDEQTK